LSMKFKFVNSLWYVLLLGNSTGQAGRRSSKGGQKTQSRWVQDSNSTS
jgi:hypothetical protein